MLVTLEEARQYLPEGFNPTDEELRETMNALEVIANICVDKVLAEND
jgi:hypothetical protein